MSDTEQKENKSEEIQSKGIPDQLLLEPKEFWNRAYEYNDWIKSLSDEQKRSLIQMSIHEFWRKDNKYPTIEDGIKLTKSLNDNMSFVLVNELLKLKSDMFDILSNIDDEKKRIVVDGKIKKITENLLNIHDDLIHVKEKIELIDTCADEIYYYYRKYITLYKNGFSMSHMSEKVSDLISEVEKTIDNMPYKPTRYGEILSEKTTGEMFNMD